MRQARIILALAISLVGARAWPQQPSASPGVPGTATPGASTAIAPPPYLQTTPIVIQPAPQVLPVFPSPSLPAQLPSQTPGSIFGPPLVNSPPGLLPQPAAVPAASPLARIAPGGMLAPQFGLPAGPEATAGPANPTVVSVVNEDLAWDQIVDVVSDYFTVIREQRARRSGQAPLEGRIETAPQTGATWLEPHRRDSVGSFNRWESTFQTIRRRAVVRVVPDVAGYLVEVIVEKELEDLPSPERATAGAATFRNDSSLPSQRLERVSRARSSPQWIPLGRDPPLEQCILAEIHARLSGVAIGAGSIFAP